MKILLVNTFYYPEVKGGAEYSVKKLAEALQADGNEITVLASGNTDNDEIIDGIKVHRRGFAFLKDRPFLFLYIHDTFFQ